MGHTLRVGSLSAVVDHLEVDEREVGFYAGPQVTQRFTTATEHHGYLHMDLGYPVPIAGNVDSWSVWQQNEGAVEIGALIGFVARWNASSNLYDVIHAMPMTIEHTGPGLWEHTQPSPLAVLAGDVFGVYLSHHYIGTPLSYDELKDDSRDIGTYVWSHGIDVVAGQEIQWDPSWREPRRISAQARGEYLGGAWVNVTDGYSKGSGGFAPTFSGGSQDVWVDNTVGALSNVEQMFNYDPRQGASIPDGYVGNVTVRLTAGAATIPVSKLALGLTYFAWGQAPGLQASVFVSSDATDARGSVANWELLINWPADAGGETGVPSELSPVTHFHVGRNVKWVQLRINNQSGSQQFPHTFLQYHFTNTVSSSTDFPFDEDGRDEWLWVSEEGSSFLLTADAASGTAVLEVENADAGLFATIAAGQSIWLRSGTTRYRYEVLSTGAGPPQIITLSANLNENHVAGEVVGSRIMAYKVKAIDGGGNMLKESAPIVMGGNFQERFYSKRTELI